MSDVHSASSPLAARLPWPARSEMSTSARWEDLHFLFRAAPTVMSEEELKCSVCHELPPGEVHQCSRGHFLCVACWNGMDEAWGGRKCPECRVTLGRANRCRVAELAIKNLPRPDGYTTPPPVRPNNRGQPLTPLLEGTEGSLVRDLEEKLLLSEAKVVSLEICLVEEIAARNEAYWDKEVRRPAVAFLTRGASGAAPTVSAHASAAVAGVLGKSGAGAGGGDGGRGSEEARGRTGGR